MREYVDAIEGGGTWDRMHDHIEAQCLFGWTMPALEVDGCVLRIFPGSNREATLEAVQAEVRKVLAQIDRGDYEEVTEFDD